MIITNIKLKNWKNFRSVDVNCGKRVFIIGPNASGKSNFLDALRFLHDVANDGFEKAIIARGGLKSIRFIDARQKTDIMISVIIDDVWKYTLTFGSKERSPIPWVVEEQVEKWSDETKTWKKILNRPDNNDKTDSIRLKQTALQQVNANKSFRDLVDFFSSIQYRHILPQLVREPKAFMPNPVDNDPFGRDLVLNIWKTPKKTRDSRLKRINNALQAAVPNFKNLSVEQDENGIPHLQINYAHWRKYGAYQRELYFSDGTLRFLALLWALIDTKGTLLLEEPELSLHEEIISNLPSLFTKVEREKKLSVRQVFITTHSTALLRDIGIGPEEVLILEPNENEVEIKTFSDEEKQSLKDLGLTVADVILPRTRPKNIEKLRLF